MTSGGSGTDGHGATGSTTGDGFTNEVSGSEGEEPTSAGDVLPAIVGAELTLSTIKFNGTIQILVTASDVDGVRMMLDGGEVTEFDELGPGEFGGESGADVLEMKRLKLEFTLRPRTNVGWSPNSHDFAS